MKALRESILDDDFLGNDLPWMPFYDAIIPKHCYTGYNEPKSDTITQPGFARFIMNSIITNKDVKNIIKQIVPPNTPLKLQTRTGKPILKLMNIWSSMSHSIQDKIKENARQWFMSQLNSAGKELVKIHGLNVKLGGRVESKLGYKQYQHSRIEFYIGDWNVMYLAVWHNFENWKTHVADAIK